MLMYPTPKEVSCLDQPMIGILLDERTFSGIRKGRTRHEAVLLYEQAAQRMNSQICYFRLKDVSLKQMKVKPKDCLLMHTVHMLTHFLLK